MKNQVITNKPEIYIFRQEYSQFSSNPSYYLIRTNQYEIYWYNIGTIYIYEYIKNSKLKPTFIEGFNYLPPDLNEFKIGRLYKAKKVLDFVIKIRKLKLFL